MKEDYYIIYEADEADFVDEAPVKADAAAKKATTTFTEIPAHAVDGRERRRRALEARERRRLEKVAKRDEKTRASEAARNAREAEYARRAREYEREKEIYRKQKEERKAARRAGQN